MIHILVENDSIKYIDGSNLCNSHQNPLPFCKECQTTVINKLNIHKDIKPYIAKFLPEVTKFPFIIYEEEEDDDNFNVTVSRTYMAFEEKSTFLMRGMFYFCDCSDDYIFGFLSYLLFVYSGRNENYLRKYHGKFQYELNPFKLLTENNNLSVMTSYENNGYFCAYLTVNPEEFKTGWYASQKIMLPVCKYCSIEDERIHQNVMTIQEIKENCLEMES